MEYVVGVVVGIVIGIAIMVLYSAIAIDSEADRRPNCRR